MILDKIASLQPPSRQLWRSDDKIKVDDELASKVLGLLHVKECDKPGVECTRDEKLNHRRAKQSLQRGVSGQLSKSRQFCRIVTKELGKLDKCEATWNNLDDQNVRQHYNEGPFPKRDLANYCSCAMHKLNTAQFLHTPWSERSGCGDAVHYD